MNRIGGPLGPRLAPDQRKRPYVEKRQVGRRIVTAYRLRAERALGKTLPACVPVHHVDGTRRDNTPLVICQDDAYHKLLHVRTRVLAVGGNPNTDQVCCRCQTPKALTEFNQGNGAYGRSTMCRVCFAVYNARHRDVRQERRRVKRALQRAQR